MSTSKELYAILNLSRVFHFFHFEQHGRTIRDLGWYEGFWRSRSVEIGICSYGNFSQVSEMKSDEYFSSVKPIILLCFALWCFHCRICRRDLLALLTTATVDKAQSPLRSNLVPFYLIHRQESKVLHSNWYAVIPRTGKETHLVCTH